MNVKKKEIGREGVKLLLRDLIDIAGGKAALPPDCSITELFDVLRVFVIYNRFDLEAFRRELKNAKRQKGI